MSAPPSDHSAAPAGWRARLDLQLRSVQGRTRIVGRRHSGPLLVQRAFYPEHATRRANDAAIGTGAEPGEPCHVYLIHPPGGVASGDDIELQATVGRNAHALLTTPAAGKFYRRGAAGAACLSQRLHVDGLLEWLPQENIFFPDAEVLLSTIVRLRAGARFFGWEIGCLGLPARALSLESGELRQTFELWLEERPLLIDRLVVDRPCLSARWGLAGNAAIGTWVGFPAGDHELELARAAVTACAGTTAACTLACTLVDGVLVCRGVGMRADQLKRDFIRLWRALRPALFGRAAVPPRIWAT